MGRQCSICDRRECTSEECRHERKHRSWLKRGVEIDILEAQNKQLRKLANAWETACHDYKSQRLC